MKMSFQLSNKHKRAKKRSLAILFVFGIGMILLLYGGVPGPLARVLVSFSDPLWRVREVVVQGVNTADSVVRVSKSALVQENFALQAELVRLRHVEQRAMVLAREYEHLRSLLGRVPIEAQGILAGVLQNSSIAPRDIAIIDAGEVQGVREDMLALSPDGDVVGKVLRAYAEHATVAYLTSAGLRTDALLEGVEQVPLVLVGLGGNTMTARISRDIVVSVHDEVFLPGFTRYRVGHVAHIEGDVEDAYRTLYIAPSVPYVTLQNIWIDTVYSWSDTIEEDIATMQASSSAETAPEATSTEYE